MQFMELHCNESEQRLAQRTLRKLAPVSRRVLAQKERSIMVSFIIAAGIVTLMPGPSMILVIMNSIQRGLANGIRTIFGMLLADAMLLVLALSGIGTIFYTSAMAFYVLKWLGVLYLLYLGVRQLFCKIDTNEKQASGSGNPFLQGFGTTMLNPKLIGFFIAFFPQFIDHKESAVAQLVVLGPAFLLVVFAIMFIYALFATGVRNIIETRSGKSIIKNTSGLSMIGCGLFAATMESH